MEIQYLAEKEEYNRPNGTFLGGFYWQQPYGLADYEEEWGRKWIDGVDLEFAQSHPFYDKTGNTRPNKEELNSRRLMAANRKSDGTWNLVGYKIEKMIFDESLTSLESVRINLKDVAEILYSLTEDV
jgi:hypothetical protein